MPPECVRLLERSKTSDASFTIAPATLPAVPLPIWRVPPETVVVPVYVLLAVSCSVPVPVFVSPAAAAPVSAVLQVTV